MRIYSLMFLIGVSLILGFSYLPSIKSTLILMLCTSLLVIVLPKRMKKGLYLPAIIILGFAWAVLHADYRLAWKLPDNLISKSVIVTGTIGSIPETKDDSASFLFITNSIQLDNFNFTKPCLIRLNWFYADDQLHIGDRWQLTVRLKPPRGFWDPGSFDYQKWLFDQGIRATGYVVLKGKNTFLGNDFTHFIIDKKRQALADAIAVKLEAYPLKGLITALAVGVRDRITDDQWFTLRGTGTNHLFAIAGLHIGLVTGFIYLVISFFWRRAGRLPLYFPTPLAAVVGSLIIALIYSALAGFSLPTQRALVMTSVFLLAILLRKNLSAWSAWCLALSVILILDPLAVLSDSFWLSFGAVALIIFGVGGRLNQKGLWWHWGRIQWVMAVGLIPFCLLFFQQTSLAGFIANAIAIPWVGFIVLPLTLIGSCLWTISATAAGWFWWCAEKTLEILWPLLNFIAHQDWLQWRVFISNTEVFVTAVIAAVILLIPRGCYGRHLGLIWGLPLLFWTPIYPANNEIRFTLLDVGQGLAAVVQTQHHILVYDTGPQYSDSFDAGNAVVIPFLRSLAINKIDMMMISHGDNDHIGGANSILKEMPVAQVITSVPERFAPGRATLCVAGQHWQWDGVNFQVLYPPLGKDDLDNDSSCVLRIDNGVQSILLTGDIEHKSEKYLISNAGNLLSSAILVAPHHGSNTSSTQAFVNSVHPHFVLFPTGYHNRFGFPKAEIIARYQAAGAELYDTAQVGAITFHLDKSKISSPVLYRKHFWD